MTTLPKKPDTTSSPRLVTAVTIAVGVLAVIGGITDYPHARTTGAHLIAALTIVAGLGCAAVGLRAKYGTARRAEIVGLAAVLAVLVIADAWLSAAPTHLFGLALPAVLLLLTTRTTPQPQVSR
ncbi:MAG: hypothetical protein JO287_20815 [Pseudonocardiales bacterium]|nr:hypothetical protein [Pseudonocardiales bacterium]